MRRADYPTRSHSFVFPLAVGLLFGIGLTLVWLALAAPQSARPSHTLAAADPYDAALTVGDAVVTSALANAAAQSHQPVTLTDLRAHIESDSHLQVSGDVAGLPTFFGSDPRQLTTDLTLSVASGQLHAHIDRATIGGLYLPTPITSTLEAAFNRQLASVAGSFLSGSSGYAIVGLTSTSGRLTLLLRHR